MANLPPAANTADLVLVENFLIPRIQNVQPLEPHRIIEDGMVFYSQNPAQFYPAEVALPEGEEGVHYFFSNLDVHDPVRGTMRRTYPLGRWKESGTRDDPNGYVRHPDQPPGEYIARKKTFRFQSRHPQFPRLFINTEFLACEYSTANHPVGPVLIKLMVRPLDQEEPAV